MGQRTFTDILDADEEVIEAQEELVFATANRIKSQFALARSLGMLSWSNLYVMLENSLIPQKIAD